MSMNRQPLASNLGTVSVLAALIVACFLLARMVENTSVSQRSAPREMSLKERTRYFMDAVLRGDLRTLGRMTAGYSESALADWVITVAKREATVGRGAGSRKFKVLFNDPEQGHAVTRVKLGRGAKGKVYVHWIEIDGTLFVDGTRTLAALNSERDPGAANPLPIASAETRGVVSESFAAAVNVP